jgi:hypothetical protein
VYVRPFPNVTDGKWVVSTGGATSARWSRDGSELFYKSLTGDLMVADIQAGSTFVITGRRTLFSHAGFSLVGTHAQYDVHPDGDRFIMVRLSAAEAADRLLVVEGFFEELRARTSN